MVVVVVLLLCLTCDLMHCCSPGFSDHGTLQARILGGLLFPSPGNLSSPGIELASPALQAESLPTELPGKPFYLHTIGQTSYMAEPKLKEKRIAFSQDRSWQECRYREGERLRSKHSYY